MPSLRATKKYQNEQNRYLERDADGQLTTKLNVVSKMKFHLFQAYNSHPSITEFRVKLCGDSTNVGRSLKLFNLNFSIINEELKCVTAGGHYLLGMLEIQNEDRESIGSFLTAIHQELSKFSFIEINDQKIPVTMFIGGDMKFQLIHAGLNAACSDFCCLNCHAGTPSYYSKAVNNWSVQHYLDSKWSMSDDSNGARSFKSADLSFSKLTEKFGYVWPPLSSSIPYSRYIVDSMHFFFRVDDVLKQLLIRELMDLESVSVLSRTSLEIKDTIYIKRLNNFLADKCGIKQPLVKLGTNNFKMRSIGGLYRNKIFSKCQELFALFPELNTPGVDVNRMHEVSSASSVNRGSKIYCLWCNFFVLYWKIKRNNSRDFSVYIRSESKNWMKLFFHLYPATNSTPYMHQFLFHFHEIIEQYGNLNLFNQEGHEKFNDLTTSHYFRASNKREDYLLQIVKKVIRLEVLSYDHGPKKTTKVTNNFEIFASKDLLLVKIADFKTIAPAFLESKSKNKRRKIQDDSAD